MDKTNQLKEFNQLVFKPEPHYTSKYRASVSFDNGWKLTVYKFEMDNAGGQAAYKVFPGLKPGIHTRPELLKPFYDTPQGIDRTLAKMRNNTYGNGF